MKTFVIVPQVEKHGKNEIEVDCKHLRFFPIEQGGVVQGFGKLKTPVYQIVISNGRTELKLKANVADMNNPAFTICHEDRMDYPTIVVGEGKKRREIPDTLSPKVRVPGLKEKYDLKGFKDRVGKLAGNEFADDVVRTFVNRIAAQN